MTLSTSARLTTVNPTTTKPVRVIGLFPGLDPRQGGVQVSGIEAVPTLAKSATDFRAIILGDAPVDTLATTNKVLASNNQKSLLAQLAIRNWRADIAIFWHIGMLKLLPFMRGFRGEVVLFLHGIEAWRKPGWLTRQVIHRVDLFLSNSEYTWQRFLDYAPDLVNRKHIVTHLGVGQAMIAPTPQSGTVPAALMLGRMAKAEDYKGHRELIAAWPTVRQRVPDAELWIAGEGDLRPELESIASAGPVPDAIKFLGRVTEERKAELLVSSRCLALPSRGEGFGLVYLEAMRVGRPCLVSDCDAGREVVNPPEAGLAVDVNNREAVAAALVRLLTFGDEWRQWSNASRARYEAHFTVAQFSSRLQSAIFGGN